MIRATNTLIERAARRIVDRADEIEVTCPGAPWLLVGEVAAIIREEIGRDEGDGTKNGGGEAKS